MFKKANVKRNPGAVLKKKSFCLQETCNIKTSGHKIEYLVFWGAKGLMSLIYMKSVGKKDSLNFLTETLSEKSVIHSAKQRGLTSHISSI